MEAKEEEDRRQKVAEEKRLKEEEERRQKMAEEKRLKEEEERRQKMAEEKRLKEEALKTCIFDFLSITFEIELEL